VEVWNSWRNQNPSITPDLSELDVTQSAAEAWNYWRKQSTPTTENWSCYTPPNLSGSNLAKAYFAEANLADVNLSRANLIEVRLYKADLTRADLTGADLTEAWCYESSLWGALLTGANLTKAYFERTDLQAAHMPGANLTDANLRQVDLSGANLSRADLTRADLTQAKLVKTDLKGATLTGCRIYGISAWSLELEGAKQWNLNVSDDGEPDVVVDNLEVAQFIYLLLNNEKLRQVIDTITSKLVLILGRFTAERKPILDAIRDALRQHGYLPILFDFEKPASRDLTETISTLAHMARFIIADITEAKSIPQELQAIVPNLPSVPVQPLLLSSDYEYGMFEHFKKYPWVLDTYYYDTPNELLASVEDKIIKPADKKASELAK
jgi:hypothetical protein